MDLYKRITKKWLNEAKQDIYPEQTERRTDATTRLRGGLKGKKGNFNIDVDTIGKANERKLKPETSIEDFVELTSHISGLATFGRNLDNPTRIGGNEITPMVVSELAKLLTTSQLENPRKNIGVVIKALKLRRPETLEMVMLKIKDILNECLEYTKNFMTTKGKIVHIGDMKDIIDEFKAVGKNATKLETFLLGLKNNKKFAILLGEMSNEKRYKKWFN